MKRHPSLSPLARDHHHALVLAHQLRADAPERLRAALPTGDAAIVAFVRERFARELEPHFEVEERFLVPRSEAHGGELRAQAATVREHHRSLRAMVARLEAGPQLDDELDAFARLLEEHVRFEDRQWFVAIEEAFGDALDATELRALPLATIAGFEQDDEGAWVALLDCGHRQHMRHQPPWQSRPWVTTERGRAAHVGLPLPCPWCRMPVLPSDAEEYRRTDRFEAETTPKGLLKRHRLKAGSWGEIVVTRGRVLYVLEDDGDLGLALTPDRPGVVAPERPHHVTPEPNAQFYVRFLRRDG